MCKERGYWYGVDKVVLRLGTAWGFYDNRFLRLAVPLREDRMVLVGLDGSTPGTAWGFYDNRFLRLAVPLQGFGIYGFYDRGDGFSRSCSHWMGLLRI